MAISHTGHYHPATPAARKACRNSNGNPAVVRIESDGTSTSSRQIMSMRTGKLIDVPKRIQPRRSGARVAARSATCVQAALHVDAHGGRCACGWIAA